MHVADLLGAGVFGSSAQPVGRLRDFVARLDDVARPVVTGLVIRVEKSRDLFVPLREVARVNDSGIHLHTSRIDLRQFARRDGEILLARDLLDKRIADLSQGRVARVSDIGLEIDDDGIRAISVDFGNAAVMSRLGLAGLFARWVKRREVPWEQVEVFAAQVPGVRLNLRHSRIAKLHPSAIARIVGDLPRAESQEIVESLDMDTLAEAVAEVEPSAGASLVSALDEERAADLLEAMSDDEAADILGDLEPGQAEDILARMDQEDADAVRALLDYPDDSAGGMMTTEYVALAGSLSANEALNWLRTAPWLPERIHDIYVLDSAEAGRLVGSLTLRDLVVADGGAMLSAIATDEIISGSPDDEPEEVARTIARYNLAALPIVDEGGKLLGIVTVDDAIGVLVPPERKAYLPRIFG